MIASEQSASSSGSYSRGAESTLELVSPCWCRTILSFRHTDKFGFPLCGSVRTEYRHASSPAQRGRRTAPRAVEGAAFAVAAQRPGRSMLVEPVEESAAWPLAAIDPAARPGARDQHRVRLDALTAVAARPGFSADDHGGLVCGRLAGSYSTNGRSNDGDGSSTALRRRFNQIESIALYFSWFCRVVLSEKSATFRDHALECGNGGHQRKLPLSQAGVVWTERRAM